MRGCGSSMPASIPRTGTGGRVALGVLDPARELRARLGVKMARRLVDEGPCGVDSAADGLGRHFVSNNQDRVATTREPMAAPNTTKYSEVDSTGEAMLCISVRKVRAISKR